MVQWRYAARHSREVGRNSDAHWNLSFSAEPEVIAEAVDLMHSLVQDGHDPDVAIRKMTPVDEMALVAEEEPFDTKIGRSGFRQDAVIGNLVELREQAGDVVLSLTVTPSFAGVAVDVIKAMRGRFLDTDGGHGLRTDSVRSPLSPSETDRISPAH
jgi:hypothetical protein